MWFNLKKFPINNTCTIIIMIKVAVVVLQLQARVMLHPTIALKVSQMSKCILISVFKVTV